MRAKRVCAVLLAAAVALLAFGCGKQDSVSEEKREIGEDKTGEEKQDAGRMR